MKRLTTSKGKTFDVEYAWAPTINGNCSIRLQDERPLAEIAEDFTGLTRIDYENTDTNKYVWKGYTVLQSISKQQDTVTISLAKG